ncbi:hypothetical protein H257_06428 [Aphanomyces astaci]|uniref:ISXO2-like transposase domain-containing protein n=1 Tax=Aphanomyces astaci TaxID=112090 RepID=W4GPQ3_APHAT|nr:hypothetical protein H257_06428 [Aphanomyces astaci]ETV80994.1 hypothetical protein H257_06428 [Aphanomyces astaci]|eukprot:XP_009829941.1 hypothetical protein H257_06428 [Aphanomyces astaci]
MDARYNLDDLEDFTFDRVMQVTTNDADCLRWCMSIGGVGSVVEIDETSLKKKSKYNRGTRHPECWLFGGVDRATKKWFGVLTYEDRTKPVLSAFIGKHIRPGTLIMSDKFGSYVSTNERHTLANNPALAGMGYTHQWVNHSENFVNAANGAHTQGIEGVWESGHGPRHLHLATATSLVNLTNTDRNAILRRLLALVTPQSSTQRSTNLPKRHR